MGKEILTGLIDADAKRGWEQARDHVIDGKRSCSMARLMELAGDEMLRQVSTLKSEMQTDELPPLRLKIQLEPVA